MNTIPLRILHLNSKLNGGGTDDQCLKLAEGLRQLGHDVWLAAPGDRESYINANEHGVLFHATPSMKPRQIRIILSAANLIRRERIQIVHAHHGCDIWPTILAAKLSGIRPKIVITRHLAKSPVSWASRRFLLGQCHALIAVSNFTAQVLRKGMYEPESPVIERRARPPLRGNQSKIHTVYGGIDTERFRPFDASAQRRAWGLASEHFAFAVAGGYDFPHGKGQRVFLQAAARIHKDVPHARFLLIGRGNMQSIIEEDIQRLGLATKAWLVPHCQDMPTAINAMDCLVHPTVATEAFGLVICEAHACGRPVIATALDGVPEAFHVGGYGTLIQPGNIDELATAMRAWVNRRPDNDRLRHELHAKITDQLSILTTARQVSAIYQSILTATDAAQARKPRSQSADTQS